MTLIRVDDMYNVSPYIELNRHPGHFLRRSLFFTRTLQYMIPAPFKKGGLPGMFNQANNLLNILDTLNGTAQR